MNGITREQWLNRLACMLNESPKEADERARSYLGNPMTKKDRPWILHGAGNLGKRIYSHMLANGYRIVAVTDGDKTRHGHQFGKHRIEDHVSALTRWKDEASVLVTIFNPHNSYLCTAHSLHNISNAPIFPVQAYFWLFPDVFLPYFAFDRPSTFLRFSNSIMDTAQLLSDIASLECYYHQLAFRIKLDFNTLPSPDLENQYFPTKIIDPKCADIFIDCGAFDGDTLKSLWQKTGTAMPKVVAYEPDPVNFKTLMDWVNTLPEDIRTRIQCRSVAVGRFNGEVAFKADGGSSSKIDLDGTHRVKIVRLDDDLEGIKLGWVKMDLEGFELDALEGAQNLYFNSTPVFSICMYHKPSDLWRIPLFIQRRFPRYVFSLRSHGPDGFELVFYAVPSEC